MHQVMNVIARYMAILGGIVLAILILLVSASVIGRTLSGILHGSFGDVFPGISNWALNLGVGPINGDFELVEAGIAFAIFAFLPICQISGGHASVDIFASKLPDGMSRLLRMITDIVFSVVLLLIAVQLLDGLLAKKGYGETTFLLQFPVWWAYAASMLGAIAAAVVGIYVAAVRVAEFLTGTTILNAQSEFDL